MNIKLLSIDYSESINKEGINPWILKGLILGDTNLIVGKNTAGKTRSSRVLYGLSNVIDLRTPLTDGSFDVTFLVKDGKKEQKLRYKLEIMDRIVIKEWIEFGGEEKLERSLGKKTKIYSDIEKKHIFIDPPEDKLVLHIRRDKTEYPFFEYLIEWAHNTKGFKFANTSGDHIEVPLPAAAKNLQSLNQVPSALDQLSDESVKRVINDFNNIGYEIEAVKTEPIPNVPAAKSIIIKEKSLHEFYSQLNMSQGMFRALSLIIFVQLCVENKNSSTIIVDDLCEGLDYEHSSKLAKYLYNRTKQEDIQFIATTNDHSLMNLVDIVNWNILIREGSTVNAFNYENNKKAFDEYKLIGLSNFDIFTSSLITKLVNKKWN